MADCQHIRCEPYRTCQLGGVVTLRCLSPQHARKVAAGCDEGDGSHVATASGSDVVLSYYDKCYPRDVAGWAYSAGHCDDDAAAEVIASL